MKFILCTLALVIPITVTSADSKKPAPIQWKSGDCSKPLMVPEHFDVSQFGKGQYRIDGGMSQGHFNCIYIIFQSTHTLDPASVTDARKTTFTVKDQEMVWRSYKTTVEGRSVIRKETVMPNLLPHQKQGNDSEYIWIRIDADSQEILDQLTPVVENVIRDAL